MNRNLALLLSGQLVSQIGDKFHLLAVAWAGYLPVFVLNAGSYLFSAGFESFIRIEIAT